MNPDLDRQQNRNRWPFPDDSPVQRARHIAIMYRTRLRAVDRAAADDCDATARQFGETWIAPEAVAYPDDKEVTTDEAASMANVTVDTIRQWACMPHPEKPGEPLLPRFGKRGRQRTYIARKVREAAAAVTRAKRQSA